MMNNRVTGKLLACCFLVLSVSFIPESNAQSGDEAQILRMFYEEKDLVETPTRKPKHVSRVAENITIITSDEIEEMNAHTLADILFTIPGVQVDLRGGPGSIAFARIQGSEFRHTRVIVDDVTLNNLSDSFADIAALPAQIIKRIEIIKGPASSSWGSSLGGIIHIITKTSGAPRTAGGLLSASYGEKRTGDYRAEISGKANSLSYYLYGGNLVSNGFRPGTPFYSNNFYSKLRWDISSKVSSVVTFGYNKGSRGDGDFSEFDRSFSNKVEYLLSSLSLNYSLSDTADLSASLRTSRQQVDLLISTLSTDEKLSAFNFDDSNIGGSIKFNWKSSIHDLVSGFDYDFGKLESNNITGSRQNLRRWAAFINDTLIVDKFAFTPGIRYDDTSTSGSFVSPGLGVTYNLGDKTILRAYAARGFSTPPLSATFGTGAFSIPNRDLQMEKVFSLQTGIESTSLKYLWLKATLFRHDIRDAIFSEALVDGTFIFVNKEKQRRQGFDFELKTIPVYNMSLSGGFVFTDAKSRDNGEILKNVPRYTFDVGIHYNDNSSLKALLQGHYIWWNAHHTFEGKYTSMIWDLSIAKKIISSGKKSTEFFLTAHNIFNGSQYLQDPFTNPGRWVEAGLRLKL